MDIIGRSPESLIIVISLDFPLLHYLTIDFRRSLSFILRQKMATSVNPRNPVYFDFYGFTVKVLISLHFSIACRLMKFALKLHIHAWYLSGMGHTILQCFERLFTHHWYILTGYLKQISSSNLPRPSNRNSILGVSFS
ncbi:hypothetical protein PoB_000705000 [Plakobranchus ocellatus]|uniref:Uncharacterized protein n=1 Tax=Plakobranchus ocellatus TaxID=259542 RepID=A0AAV3YDD8_9GAST|nr:hypothetical protein PoB_000705000 [Plakobranchus ocellatus]